MVETGVDRKGGLLDTELAGVKELSNKFGVFTVWFL